MRILRKDCGKLQRCRSYFSGYTRVFEVGSKKSEGGDEGKGKKENRGKGEPWKLEIRLVFLVPCYPVPLFPCFPVPLFSGFPFTKPAAGKPQRRR